MKPYRDAFGTKIPKKDIEQAVKLILFTKKPTAMMLSQYQHIGIAKANKILGLLEDAGVLKKKTDTERVIILSREAEAINAALRQLKKGRK